MCGNVAWGQAEGLGKDDMHILEQILAWGRVFLNWYVVYVLVAGGVFAGYLVYRLWLPDSLKPKQDRSRSAHHGGVD